MADDSGRLNDILADTAFLGGGEVGYIEALRDRWAADPASVDPSWRAVFQALHDGAAARTAPAVDSAPERPEWLSAIDGRWPDEERKPVAGEPSRAPEIDATEVRARTLDSLRAIMMIRAYRVRGHLKAKLDPLGLATQIGDASELDPATYGFGEGDWDRPIFLDYVLGLENATLREIWASFSAPTAARSACSTCTSPTPPRRRGFRSGSKGAPRRSASPRKARSPSSRS